MKQNNTQYNQNIIVRKIGKETILVPTGKSIDAVRSIYTLNETAAFILEKLKAGLDEAQIVESLMQEFDCEEGIILRNEVGRLMNEFKSYGILL